MTRIRSGAGLALAAILFAACGAASTTSVPASQGAPSQAPASQAAASTAPSAAVGTPKDGGDLIVALPGEIATTDSAFSQDSNTSYVLNQVVQSLVGLKPGTIGDLAPSLAKSWTVSDDGLSYTFALQEGVKFHDGTDFNADAVCYNYNRWNNFTGALASTDYAYYYGAVFGGFGATSNLDSCKADGANGVVIKLKKPYTAFLLSQTISTFGINSPTALKKLDADNPDPTKSAYGTGAAGSMIGTGPFMFKEWKPADHVLIAKNPDYWDKAGTAHLDSVKFIKIADTTASLNALQAGDIDLASVMNPVDIPTMKSDPNLQVIERGESCNLFHLGMNSTHKPFDNPKIREAVGYAINRQNLVDTFYGGNDFAVVASTWMPPTTFSAKDVGLPTYDPDKAKQLIQESGLTGDQLTIEFHYPSDVFRPYMPDPKGIFQAIQTDLEAVGFKIVSATKPWSNGYLKEEAKGLYPMWLIGWTCDWAGPDNFLDTAFFWHDGKGEPNPEFAYKNPDLFSLIDKAKAQISLDASKPLWEQAQDLVRKDLPTMPLVDSKPVAGAKAIVQGFIPAGNLSEALNTVWLNK
jgi:peptide/nickel transport system substrate-binding protein